nr:hypothetical protein [Kibdelosporangium sp. MJ126-NF4]CTQ98052.1 hypothetical protein [Kibdelosporangium sp. MJ126-NF4]
MCVPVGTHPVLLSSSYCSRNCRKGVETYGSEDVNPVTVNKYRSRV